MKRVGPQGLTRFVFGREAERLECDRAGVAELADAQDLKSCDPKGRPGSMPGPGTTTKFSTMRSIRARALAAVLAAGTLAASWGASAASQEQTERNTYYTITGSSARELRDAMNAKRPVGKDGRPHDAITSWFVRWRYTTTGASPGCAVKTFNVALDITMTLPQWTNESDAAPQLLQQWRTYFAALMKHEEGHKAIGNNAAADIRDGGSRLPSAHGCSDLAKTIETMAGEILERYRQREREYDRDTDHGRTQGARFP
jgi:predicted secreted Zn-dependent protease